MIHSIRTFKGGYRFKNYAGQVRPVLLEDKIPPQVIIPLKQGFGTEVKPLVKKGDAVLAGQIIGRDDASISSPVHSSVNGVVEDIKRMNYFKRDVTMAVIRTTNTSKDILRLDGYSQEWGKLTNEKIEELIYTSGVSSLDREGIPTHFKSSIISPADVRHLIIHGVGSEPYNISLDLLLEGKNLLNFFEGIKKLIEQLGKLSYELQWLDIYPLEPKYPQGYDEMLVPTILRQKFPYGYSAANIGVVILNIRAVLAAYEAVAEGKPYIERIIALCGPSM